jgi:hypothetical protein
MYVQTLTLRRVRVTAAVERQYRIFWVCVCSLSYAACKQMRRIILLSVACPALPYFSKLFHKQNDFQKALLNIQCVLLYSTTFVWNISQSKNFSCQEKFNKILSQMYTGIHVKYPLLLSDFNETWRFSTDFRKKCSNIKFHENPPSGSRVSWSIRAGRRRGQQPLFAILRTRLNTHIRQQELYPGRPTRWESQAILQYISRSKR